MKTHALSCVTVVVLALGMLGGAPARADTAVLTSKLPIIPEQFHTARPATGQPTATVPNDSRWWTIFGDPALDAFVARAERGSSNIGEAVARLSQARAQLRVARAAQLPQVDIGGNASRQTGALINAAGGGGTLYSLGGNFSYELDVLGKLSKTKKAAKLDADAAERLVHSAHLLVQADTVQAYFEIRTLDEERAVVASAVASNRIALDIVEARRGTGLTSELEVVRARSELATVNSELLALDRRRAEVEHSLSFLMGEASADLEIAGDAVGAPPLIPSDIPSNVLARRPDVAAAQRKLGAATLRVGVAKNSWLPQLSLTGSRGYASPSLGNLLQSATQNFGLGFLLSLPFLDGGRRAATINSANADVELAAAEYRTQILTALRDVENQLSAVRLLDEQARVLEIAGAASLRSSTITEARYRNGMISQLALLEASRVQLKDRRTAVQNKFARYVATIGLVRALGGGWGETTSTRTINPEPQRAATR